MSVGLTCMLTSTGGDAGAGNVPCRHGSVRRWSQTPRRGLVEAEKPRPPAMEEGDRLSQEQEGLGGGRQQGLSAGGNLETKSKAILLEPQAPGRQLSWMGYLLTHNSRIKLMVRMWAQSRPRINNRTRQGQILYISILRYPLFQPSNSHQK